MPVTPVSASSGLELATGDTTGEATGDVAGDALTPGLATTTGEPTDGEGDEGQRPQVAAQYPPAGAPAANMKGALHCP